MEGRVNVVAKRRDERCRGIAVLVPHACTYYTLIGSDMAIKEIP
jgi:hypothetical protein